MSVDEAKQRYQNIVVMRHGDRIDNFDPSWAINAERKWDPPLIEAGKTRAFNTGRKLRENLGFPIHRIFASPFLRCLQTAAGVLSGLCSNYGDPTRIDVTNLKVSIEYGLCEMLNTTAIRPPMAPEDRNFTFNILECEAIFPGGTVDHTVKPVYQKLPTWEETVAAARDRYVDVIKALADRYPSENLLLVTHAEGVGVSVSAFAKEDLTVYEVEYCAYSELRRFISFDKDNTCTANNLEVVLDQVVKTGISYYSASKLPSEP
ncbi:hypothetical protein ACET3Z_013546 [Daucus carota]